MVKRFRQVPGEKPSGTGKFIEVKKNGSNISNPKIINITSDDGHLPPTQMKNRIWKPI